MTTTVARCGVPAARSASNAPAPRHVRHRQHALRVASTRCGRPGIARRAMPGRTLRCARAEPRFPTRWQAHRTPSSCPSTAGTASGPCMRVLGRDALPIEQEAQEVARQHRLDLGAQTFDGVAVDAREQPAIAPLNWRCRCPARSCRASRSLRLPERAARHRRRTDPTRKRSGDRASVRRTEPFEAAAHDLAHRFARDPIPSAGRRHGDVGLEGGSPGKRALSSGKRSAANEQMSCARHTPLRIRSLHQRRPRGFALDFLLGQDTSASTAHRAARRRCPLPATLRSRTRAIASGSSLPISAADSGSIQRRLITACVRRSSSGASSR